MNPKTPSNGLRIPWPKGTITRIQHDAGIVYGLRAYVVFVVTNRRMAHPPI